MKWQKESLSKSTCRPFRSVALSLSLCTPINLSWSDPLSCIRGVCGDNASSHRAPWIQLDFVPSEKCNLRLFLPLPSVRVSLLPRDSFCPFVWAPFDRSENAACSFRSARGLQVMAKGPHKTSLLSNASVYLTNANFWSDLSLCTYGLPTCATAGPVGRFADVSSPRRSRPRCSQCVALRTSIFFFKMR